MNFVALSGRVAQEIKLYETSNNNHVITINLAVKSDYFRDGEEPKTDFIPVTVWGKQAENLACKNISDILTAPMAITRVGTKKASKIYVIKEVVRRIMEESPNDNPIIHGPEDVAKFFMPI
ncbi:single-stranded DNA-binding protein [Selenomonas ruminantium]|uniref:Single-strand binding protein family protein n=1 Tax=Selenomonas ruminantium TaxID=971 RepID=A0A1I0V651_SELRU|nr:single-stranded DNA-binding protein [Selenomonas ruminantium]SFA71758.1 Single-strand binding protein family protein [Selenomonas ruminantium]